MQLRKILNIAKTNPHLQDIFSKELGVSKVLGQVLINRGIGDIREAEKFLDVRLEHLLDPWTFADMDKAVKLIKRLAHTKEKIMIFGDYDVDGLTSITLLKTTLSKMGLDVVHYLPHRIKEGYGLNKNVLQIVKQRKIKLLITVDCGTNSHQQIRELRGHNIEVIVTDHHEPLNNDSCLASAIINPKLKGSGYKYKYLSGVGVVFKLCQAITAQMLCEDLDLVCLGTIADVVPLTGENRIIAKEGLLRLTQTKRVGLKALIEISGIGDQRINSNFVSYILGPRINSSGRLDSAEVALDLLMAQEERLAEDLAKIMDMHNRQRKKIENKIFEEAEAIVDKEINFKEHKIMVLAKEDWHQGVLGIVASKLVEKFYRPAIVISKSSDLCRGSGRSIKNFHLFQALLECQDFLKTFGGHSQAAGLVISKDKIEEFKEKINRLASERLNFLDLLPSLDIDMELTLSDLNEAVIAEFEMLEPFGVGNPETLFFTRNLRLRDEPQVLGKNTLKFWVSDGNLTYQAIGFGWGGFRESLLSADDFDLVYRPRLDNWYAQGRILLEIKDIFFK